MTTPALRVLLVDDNESDVELALEAFKEFQGCIDILTAADGREALAFLKREGRFVAAPEIDLILLDLNMPVMDGRDLLRRIKQDESLAAIPVVVFTSSNAEEDVRASYELGASGFITKQFGMNELFTAVRRVAEYWLTITRRPRRDTQ